MTKKVHHLFNWRIIKYGLTVVCLSMILIFIPVTSACQAADWWKTAQEGGLDQVGKAYGGGNLPQDIRMTVADMIKIVLGFLGIISIIIILFAGFKWMTAGGSEDKVGEAKKMLTAGLIGLIVVLSTYALANFVISQLYSATTGTAVVP